MGCYLCWAAFATLCESDSEQQESECGNGCEAAGGGLAPTAAGSGCGYCQRMRSGLKRRRQQLNVDNSSGLAVESGQTAERLQRDSERAKEQATADTKERGRARRGSPPSSVRSVCTQTEPRTDGVRAMRNKAEERRWREKVTFCTSARGRGPSARAPPATSGSCGAPAAWRQQSASANGSDPAAGAHSQPRRPLEIRLEREAAC